MLIPAQATPPTVPRPKVGLRASGRQVSEVPPAHPAITQGATMPISDDSRPWRPPRTRSDGSYTPGGAQMRGFRATPQEWEKLKRYAGDRPVSDVIRAWIATLPG